MRNNNYRYNLTSTGESSNKLGLCDVCGKHVTEVHHQTEEKHYKFEHDNTVYEGWTQHECNSYFGHEACLKNKQRGIN
jgi:hypothetical protein